MATHSLRLSGSVSLKPMSSSLQPWYSSQCGPGVCSWRSSMLPQIGISCSFTKSQWASFSTCMTRDLFNKIRVSKGMFYTKVGTIKERNGTDLTEAEDTRDHLPAKYLHRVCRPHTGSVLPSHPASPPHSSSSLCPPFSSLPWLLPSQSLPGGFPGG